MTDRPLSPQEYEQVVSTLNNWMVRCRVALSAYNDATSRANSLEWRLGIPASILSAIVATGVFATLRSDPGLGWRVATGIAALAAASLTALQTFLQPAERAEQYREAARHYGHLRRQIERAQLFMPTTLEAANAVLDEIAAELTEVARGKPNVPRFVWDRAEYKVKGTADARGLRALGLRMREAMSFGIAGNTKSLLPEDHIRYFDGLADAVIVPIEDIYPSVPPSEQPNAVKESERRMREAAAGRRSRRDPLSVQKHGDGRYVIEDGNATWAVARQHGWRTLPVRITGVAVKMPD